jgi:hypothetical protein
LSFVPYFIEKKTTETMAHWLGLSQAARHYASTTPGFLPAPYVIQVMMAGGPYDYVVSLGYDVNTQRGEEAVNFHVALHNLCLQLCVQRLGWVPYHPAPLIVGPPPPVPGEAGAAAQGQDPAAQQNNVADPVGEGQQVPQEDNVPPGADDNEEAEADQLLHVIMLD